MTHHNLSSGDRHLLRLIFPLACAILLTAGKCNTGNCDTLARVSDQSGLDGCNILLELADGQLLLPTNLADYGIQVSEGDTVSISYTVIPDAMSVCMKETASVTLTCFEALSE